MSVPILTLSVVMPKVLLFSTIDSCAVTEVLPDSVHEQLYHTFSFSIPVLQNFAKPARIDIKWLSPTTSSSYIRP
jgi:hypothetical protein